ncbi:unnamed protein product [Caenorhabditis nigoni]
MGRGRGSGGGASSSGGIPLSEYQNIEPLDEESLNDRTQTDQGLFEGKIVMLNYKSKASKTEPMEARAKKWAAKSPEEKVSKFNKIFHPQSTKKWPPTMKEPPVESVAFFVHSTKGKFGMPLKKFPEQKYDHQRIVVKKAENPVDYSIDEHDITWLMRMNAHQASQGKTMLTVATFEHWVDRLEKNSVWKPKEHHKLRDEHGEELEDVCNICLDPDTSNCNQIVYCDRCNLTVHQDCYGIPFIPEGCLECRRCVVSPAKRVSCVLCPSRTGAFKQVDHKRWVHVLCVIWVDETHFGNTIFMENVQNVEKALHDRRALSCMLCKQHDPKHARMGACIQCSESKCTASFHVTCARNHGLIMRIVELDNGFVKRFVWCPRHRPQETEADKEQHERMLRNQKRENERMLPQISMPTLTSGIINQIQSERPFAYFREIVLFWYQRRQNRLGAPLLKTWTPPESLIIDLFKTPERRRRGSSGVRATTTTMILDSEELEKKKEEFEMGIQKAMEMFAAVMDEEKEKVEMSKSSLKMLELGFKTNEMYCAETLENIKRKDTVKVFEKPVQLPIYTTIIKNPISFEEMTQKAAEFKYNSITQLQADVALMISNCSIFNKKNPYYYKYGITFKRQTTPMLEAAARAEAARTERRNDKEVMTEILNGFLNANSESEGTEDVVEEDSGAPGGSGSSGSSGKRGRRRRSPGKIEEIKEEVKMEEEPPAPALPSKRGRKRAIQETLDSEEAGPSTSSGAPGPSGAPGAPGALLNAASTFFKPPQTRLFRGAGFPGIHKKFGASISETPKGPQKQTKMTAFLTRGVTFEDEKGAGGDGDLKQKTNKNKKDNEKSDCQQQQHILFQSINATPSNSTKLFPNSFTSILASFTGIPTIPRPVTRSSTASGEATSSETPKIQKSKFRISSSALQSPLPDPKRVGIRAMDSEDDDEEEILIQPIQKTLSPEELKSEQLRCAENEAKSKFAHNQLVIVEGRAAKVIDYHLAHLSDIHLEQRQSMLKKRREVLAELPSSAPIYVEFFQKSNILENFQWVPSEKVELLDLNNCAQKGKITGLKAAKEWHQKVLNGETI